MRSAIPVAFVVAIALAGSARAAPPVAATDRQVSELDTVRETVDRVIKTRSRALRACYSDALKRAPDVPKRGSLHLSIAIGVGGRVRDVKVLRVLHAAVDPCVVRLVKRLSFPLSKAQTPVDLDYPIVFVAAE